ncbi:MAG: tetratricopeptide repeat protein [Bacteroidales bacterium]
MSNYSTGIAKACNNIGLIYKEMADYDMAIEYYNKSLDIEKKADNWDGILNTTLNIGNIYYALSNFNKALSLYFDGLRIAEDRDDIKGIQDSYNNIGSTYSELNNVDSALYYLNRSYEISLELNDIENQASILNNLGTIFFAKNDYATALEYYHQALEIETRYDDLWSEANTVRNIGGVYLMMEKFDKALDYFSQAVELSKRIEAKNLLMSLYGDISEVYEFKGDFEQSLQFYKRASNLNDSIYNEESARQIAEIEAQYTFRNKDQQLQLVTKDNELKSLKIKTQTYLIYIFASLIVLVLVLVIVFYTRSRNSRRARVLLEEKNERITEQKILLEKTISELRESEEKQKSLIENIRDGIIIIQGERLIFTNPAMSEIAGYSSEEMYEMTFRDIIAPEDLKMIQKNYRKRMEGKPVPASYEFKIKHKSGNIVFVLLSVGIINYQGKKALLGTLRDITSQRRFQEDLLNEKEKAEQATRSKSMFLAGMSHEIRNHMSSIIGITEVLEETNLTKEQKEYLSIINASGNNLLTIINEILDFSKIEAGQVVLEILEFDLFNLVNDVKLLQVVKCKQEGLYLETVFRDNFEPKYFGDPTRISQVLINFVSNAIKFTDSGGITITLKLINDPKTKELKNRHFIRFEVTDTGIGISKDSQQKLFKPFSQTHAAVQRKVGGTGLGLAICKQLVELMGGEIGVESTVGKGSTFWFSIPLHDLRVVEPVISESVAAPPAVVHKNKMKVLLVEDNLLNQQLTANILAREGYLIDIAENGKVGLDFYKQNFYDVLLMDIQMPVMDGIQATRLIREFEEKNNSKRVKIVAVTAHTKEGEQQKLFDVGIDYYLSKPFKPAELLKVLNDLDIL